jgi:tellurium resistance protein TerZ
MAINLVKGQKISLQKETGGTLSKVAMGLGWDVAPKKSFWGTKTGIDLDASCVLFDDSGNLVDAVWFRQLRSKDGSVIHSGDNRTGAGEGDDETITVDLSQVPAGVKSLVFVVNSFTGESFDRVNNAFCRLVNLADGQELARYDLSGGGPHTAQIMAKVYRHDNEWKMHAIGESASGQTFEELLPAISPHL